MDLFILKGGETIIGTPRDLRRSYHSVIDLSYEQSKKFLLVGDIMSRNVVTIKPEATMDEAARVMGEKHIGSLIIIEDNT